ncbi:PAS domain S-box protein [bacterium]|nr:PAS domain S-box protein [bacterium]MBU1990431.1 PAS domain S-box protein [bacterium]
MKKYQKSTKEMYLLGTAFALLILFVVGSKIFAFYQISQMHAITSDIYEHPLKVTNAALTIQAEISKIDSHMKDFVLAKSEKESDFSINEMNRHEQLIYDNLKIIEQNILGKDGLKVLNQAVALFESWKKIREEIISLAGSKQISQAVALLQTNEAQHVMRLDTSILRLYDYAHGKALEFKNRSDEMLKTIETIAFTVSLFLLLMIAFYTINRVSRYIRANEHLSRVLSIVREINQLIVREKNPQRLIQETCVILTSKHIYSNAWIILSGNNGKFDDFASADSQEDTSQLKNKMQKGWIPYCIQKTIDSQNNYSTIETIKKYCQECPLVDLYKNNNAFNIELQYNEKIYGYLTLSISDKNENNENEIALLNEVAGDIAYALYNIEMESALKESEKRYRALFKSNRAIELLINPQNGQIIDCNEKALSYYGYSYEEMLSMHISDINILSKDEILLEMELAEQEYRDMFYFKHKLASGEIRDVEVYSGPIEIDEKLLLYSIVFDVTERLKLEKYKADIEDRYRFASEAATDGIWDWNLLTNEVYFSPKLKAILGYRDDEMKSSYEEWSSRIHPEDKDQIFIDLKAAHLQDAKLFKNIHRLKHRDGHWIWIESRAHTIFNDNKPVRMVGSKTDITAEYNAKEALRESEKRFKSMMEHSPYAVELYDIDGLQIEVNHAQYVLWGVPSSLTCHKFNILKSELVKDSGLLEYVKRAYAGETVQVPIHEYDASLVPETKKHGRKRTLNTRIYPLKDSSGNVKNIVLTHEDVTEKEDTLKLLEYKKKELETIIQEAPNPIMLHNESGDIIMLNKVCASLIGYDYEDISTIEKFILNIDAQERVQFREYIETLYTSDKKVDIGEYNIMTKNGDVIVWQFSSAPLGIIDAKRTFITSAMDITELKKKDELMIMQSRHAAMGEMIGMIAHQWRQPIAGISMDANNMLVDIAIGDFDANTAEKYSRDILEQTSHLSKTIDDFRNFFKPDKTFSKVKMQTIIGETYAIVKESLINNNIEFKAKYNSYSEVSAYQRELMQVFVNIINNAKDSLVSNGIKNALISINVYDDGKYVNTEVCNNGTGIEEDILQKIFDPYFTTKDEKNGTGLGLYMSKMIIEEHLNGKIDVCNSNQGVCFIIRLLKSDDADA